MVNVSLCVSESLYGISINNVVMVLAFSNVYIGVNIMRFASEVSLASHTSIL